MHNRFFTLGFGERTKFQLKLILLTLLILTPLIFLSFHSGLYFFAPIFLWAFLSIIAPFFDMPSMIKSGKITYLSLFLIAEKEKNNQIIIHGGTLFDYYFSLDPHQKPKERKLLILAEYLSGILKLINSNQDNPGINIKGTTYILNERTAKKIGFKVERPDMIQKIILVLNYPNLFVTKSFAEKKLSFPKLGTTKTYISDIRTLNENTKKIERLRNIISGTGID
ncbi:hypothetical protein ML462_14600 [Gramella lutea]|uniref:Uncharacterized protein n=1 Tax=Christiangramia lutea TaxID=1607951 RepID=A0A9X1V510_9FLAO|nr:hypothetical protein [Christiangramia lutea]MCH4824400.1 hypothetical protein [Christiangramia lutea]